MDAPNSPSRLAKLAKAVAVVVAFTLAASIATMSASAAAAQTGFKCNIVNGANIKSQQLARLYKAVFHRAPEPRGWNYWKGVYTMTPLLDIAAFFVQAPEFTNLYGLANNDDFVRLVYQNVMGRDPDPAGHDHWLGLLNRGEIGRARMVLEFSESPEFKRRENDVYFERCPLLVPAHPSVLGSILRSSSDPDNGLFTPTADDDYSLALDGGDGTSLYALVVFGDPLSNGAARRSPGETCTTVWNQNSPFGQGAGAIPGTAQATYSALWDSRFSDRLQLSRRIATFAEVLDFTVGQPEFVEDECVDDDVLLVSAHRNRFSLLTETAAATVNTNAGTVTKTFELDTEQLRLAAAANTGIHDLIRTLDDDLRLVDEITQRLIDAGYTEYAGQDRASLSLTTKEDLTGNALAFWGTYSVALTQSSLNAREWQEQFVFHRLPAHG